MNERFTEQASEILAICQRLGVDPAALGDMAGIKPETMRKYIKGYQKASDVAMQSLRNAEQIGSVMREVPVPYRTTPETKSPHAWMETSTLEKTLCDLSSRLSKVSQSDRRHVLGNIRDVLIELERREVNSSPLSEEQHILKRAGDEWDQEHSPKS